MLLLTDTGVQTGYHLRNSSELSFLLKGLNWKDLLITFTNGCGGSLFPELDVELTKKEIFLF